MNIQLQACTAQDADELFAFERDNRRYFEQSIPSRGDDYYEPETFRERHASLLQEQLDGKSFFFLIKNETGSILGRINLVDRHPITKRAELGYRIGRLNTVKGIATQAVRLLMEYCPALDIQEIQAKTTDGNTASQIILSRNGFKRVNEEETAELNGQQVTLIQFKRIV
ncbi:GCN5-related N-acetyltransferase [Exiguobacterium sibiricum 255-15]|uniref:GCN5-related N-acetyltransferase n=1 Tax=Exiguobacterium sibiricum (strain DSM 17290 / CCUG 55495 / CIP 109462 / JCM 13490 / 255-15) TaxID=262543 RepID=B1YG17_EXIS2|nr:GNAT family N-acetyltransferase [Exiguobacterium sibiricum]ACB60944.1 GCN5-related N-acetyltransferase [Exiguobacterium sibiricum 255-15]